jgi:hypothetical protein
MIYIAYGDTADWNALTPAQQAFYNGGNYVSLGTAVGALPATPTEAHELRAIGNTSNTLTVTMPATFNGQKLCINNMGFTYSTSRTGDDIIVSTGGCKVEIKGFVFNQTADKTAGAYHIRLSVTTLDYDMKIHKNKSIYKGFETSGINLDGTGTFSVYNNVFANFNNEAIAVQASPVAPKIENNTFYNCQTGINLTTNTTAILKNNNLIGCNTGISGTYVDSGFNVTSDLTGSTGKTSKFGKIEVFPIVCAAGTCDFSAKFVGNRTWYFADGTTSTVERPAKVLATEQTVYLVGNFNARSEINDNNTNALYKGTLNDIPKGLESSLILVSCTQATGSLSDLQGRIKFVLSTANCSLITGDLLHLKGNITSFLNLNFNNITGSLDSLGSGIQDFISLRGCNVNGVLDPNPNMRTLNVQNTLMSTSDVDSTVIALDTKTTATGTRTLTLTGLNRTVASTAAVTSLRAKGWTVNDATVV